MATGNRALSLLVVLSGVVASRATAQQVPAPRALSEASGPDGPSIDISRLDDPVELERRLRAVLRTDLDLQFTRLSPWRFHFQGMARTRIGGVAR